MPFISLLVSAFLHALWNALLKRERSPQVAVGGVLSFALLFTLAALPASSGPAFASRASFAWGLGAGVFEGIYFLTLAAALARADYGVVYTVARGGAMLVVWPAAAFLLGEPVTTREAGACLVGIGLALCTGRRLSLRSVSGVGIAFAAACAAAVAGYHLCYDQALRAGAGPTPLFTVALATALPMVLVSIRSRVGTWGPNGPGAPRLVRWAFAGLLCAGSFLLFLHGLSLAGAGVALTLRNSSIVFAQGLAYLLGERPTRTQVTGAFLVSAGAVLSSAF